MPYTIPHTFRTLRNSGGAGQRRSLLVMGAGMSFKVAPLPPALLAEKGAQASALIGCNPPLANESLYAWAERAHAHLVANNDPNPKLTLGKALDLLTDRRWQGYAATERSSPRHRVVARFGREGLWEQIWSLNWDCVQESALTNVGIVRDHVDPRLPWNTGFRTFVTTQECRQLAEECMVHIVKPHGCVGALASAETEMLAGRLPNAVQLASRFLITQSELDAVTAVGDPAQTFIFATLCSRLAGHPLVAVGWRASEAYLLDHIDAVVRPILDARPLADDELCVIDLAFQTGHVRLAQCYRMTALQAHVPVFGSGFTTDDLFLWIQALFGLERLRLAVGTRAADVQAIGQIEADIAQPPDHRHFAIEWVDNFLPIWVRLCWRCGLIECHDRHYQPLPAEEFDLERRDEHVPWNLSTCPRPDLISAGIFLAALHRTGHGDVWDFTSFPGGLYRDSDGFLIIPLPGWRSGTDNELRGLRPLLDPLCVGAGLPVASLAILPLTTDNTIIDPNLVEALKAMVAARIGVAAFGSPARIGVVGLADL